MKLTIFLLLFPAMVFAQLSSWTAAELQASNTANEATYMTVDERNVIQLINLARLYPKKFAETELKSYQGAEGWLNQFLTDRTYYNSLMETLMKMEPVKPIMPDKEMYEYASCFALEQSKTGAVGHDRKTCKDGNTAECCSYGMKKPLDIVMQLLIDHDVKSLGHRNICLGSYLRAGVSIQTHPGYKNCAVLDLLW
jgi:hypothetical protein